MPSNRNKNNTSPPPKRKCVPFKIFCSGCGLTLATLVIAITIIIIYESPFFPYKLRERQWQRVFECRGALLYDFLPLRTFDSLFPHTAKLPHSLTQEEKAQRALDLSEHQRRYQYAEPDTYSGYPPSIADFGSLKCDEDFGLADQVDFFGDQRRATLAQLFNKIFLKNFNDLQAYTGFFKSVFMHRPPVVEHWNEDTEFGRQRLAGVNPALIVKIEEIPSKFVVDLERLKKFLTPGISIKEELAAGKFYFEDFEILSNVPVLPGTKLYPTMTLLYVNSKGNLIPVAIQLTQEANSTVFYPDEGNSWTFAKVCVQGALAIHHQIITHLLKTHLYAEVWAIATKRALHSSHPVHLLLHNHFQKTLSINNEARVFLVPQIIRFVTSTAIEGSVVLGSRAYKQTDFKSLNFINDLKQRGVWDPSKPLDKQELPNYDFRDFGLPVWNAIHKYVTGIVNVFYPNDEMVASDAELKNWATEIAVPGKMRGFPSSIKTKAELIDTLATIIWTCSAQHAAVNFIQYDMLAWVPNMPLALELDKTPTKAEINESVIVAMMPDFYRAAGQVSAVKVLSQLPPFRWQTIMYPVKWSDSEATKVRTEFIEELELISLDVAEKNAQQGRTKLTEYFVLDPKRIPLSIGI